MLRGELLSWLRNEFSAVTAELKLSDRDDPDGYKPVLDATLRLFSGIHPPPAELIPGLHYSSVDDVQWAATYFALLRFLRKAVPQVNVQMGGGLAMSKARSQTFAHLKDLLDNKVYGAAVAMQQRGLIVEADASWELALIHLNHVAGRQASVTPIPLGGVREDEWA